MKPLAFNENGDFKILQLADLHFTNEEGTCRDIPADVNNVFWEMSSRQWTDTLLCLDGLQGRCYYH